MILIPHQTTCQKYIFKIHSSRLRREKWKLTLPLSDARKNDELISLADSQILRWIDELNGIVDADARARDVKAQIRRIKKEPNSIQNKKKIRQLYSELDDIQFKPDYLCLIIDKEKDYHRACRGFSVNGISYRRLLGTNGGIKNSTIVFVSERLSDELKRRVENGRRADMELVPAKLEAHKALVCSASIPVSMPHGILVVDDCLTHFKSDVIFLTDEGEGDPLMETRSDEDIELNASDGCGMMLPSLAERWSQELGLDYVMSGANTRFAYEKGMAFTFDFLDFGEKVAHGNYLVKDAWGNTVDIRNVELVLTTSMLKLWDSYDSLDDYLAKSLANHYTFGITKTCPKELESERSTNYQFLQSFALNDDDIEELVAPTMNEIREVLGGDWRKTILFLKGSGLNEKNVRHLENDIVKAIMIDPRMIDDPYVQSTVYRLIKNRIEEAKVGVLKVHGNYSIISGDPYALCQSIYGLEITGILKAGEIYNRYWSDIGSEKLICFRAPMTCHNNIRLVRPADSESLQYWFKYMNTCTVFNAWDTAMPALNGCDFDGDSVMLTDNPVLVRRHEELPALMCIQRKAAKITPTEEDLIQSNIDSFGSDIGRTTNYITSMFEIRSHFDPNSEEYKTLSYRIQCGQLFQQNAIDKAKGIVCKPMPRQWYDKHAVNRIEDEKERTFQREIVAEKKPYFMRYIYPALMKQYKRYIKKVSMNTELEFEMSIEDLTQIPDSELTDRQREFLMYYEYGIPVGVSDCVMNRICRRFEQEFDKYLSHHNSNTKFDYTIMRTDAEYSKERYYSVKKLYDEFNAQLRGYAAYVQNEHINSDESTAQILAMNSYFKQNCDIICQNADTLCNIVLDLCYKKSATKKFAWSMCSEEIIESLLNKNDRVLWFPTLDADGDIEYCGQRYSMKSTVIEVSE